MPVKRIIEGGEHLLGLAESRLRAIKSIASKTGGFLKEVLQPEGIDGPIIEVSVTPTLDRIWIRGSEGIDILSGVIAPGRLSEVIENAGTPDQKIYRVVQSFYPASIQAEIEKSSRGWRNERKIAVEAIVENKRINNPYIQFAQTADVCPAQYSGKMVLAAQLAMGLKDVVIEYQHSFLKTHGIYMAGDVPWLIEISGTIRAMKLSGVKKAKNKKLDGLIKTKFPMIPDGKAFPTGAKLDAALEKGDVRILGSANAFYGACGPYFLDCGWSFNDSGTEAVNVGWSWPDDYKRGHLWKVTITGDENGPASASCNEVEQGFLFNAQAASRLAFPTGNSNEVYTFDMKKFGFVQTPPSAEWAAPVYAFYVGDSLQVYRHKIFKDLVPARATGWIPFDPIGSGNQTNIGSDTGGTPTLRSYYGVNCSYSSGYSGNSPMDYTGPGIPDPVIIPGEDYINRILHTEVVVGAAERILGQGVRCTMASAAICTENSGMVRTYQKQNSLIISPRNRSCVFVGTAELKTTGGFNVDKTYFLGIGVAHGTSYTQYNGSLIETTSGTIDAGLNMFDKLVLGYSHSGSYSPVDMTFVAPNYYVSTEFTGVDIVGTYSASATPSSVPPGGVVSPSVSFPGLEIGTYYGLNNGNTTESAFSNFPERDSFYKSFSVSPDPLGNFTYLSSGYSGFLGSRYASKFPNGTSGVDIHTLAADGEDTGPWGILVSWVGYS